MTDMTLDAAFAKLIAARGLSLARGGRSLLDAIDFDVAPREIVTIIGPNGAGKTTLIRMLLGLQAPDSGKIERRPGLRVGYVPQRFEVDATVPISVRRFLTLVRRAGPDEIARALAEVGASHLIDAYASNLSGGEFRRVALARALIGDPDLLVLDEPAQGVDMAGEAALYRLIARLRDERDLGVVLVSHDLHVVLGASDRVVCLNRHVCCEGAPDRVAAHPEYARLFGPETARAYGVYVHRHDHAHDLAGAPVDRDTQTHAGCDHGEAPR
jgi:zinc transport system ATP-binding protein